MVTKLDCTGPCGDVVEFGCGYGTFTIPTAQLTSGRVIALDIEPEMVAETVRKAEVSRLSNVVGVVVGSLGGRSIHSSCPALFSTAVS